MIGYGSPVDIRPRRTWYVTAVLLLVFGVAAGAVFFVIALRPATGTFRQFAADQPVVLHLHEGERHTIYASVDGMWPVCTARPAAGIVLRHSSDVNVSNSSGSWYAKWDILANRTGRYRLTCQLSGTDAGTQLALGPYGSASRLILGILGGLLCPGAAFLVAAIMCLVVGLRRHSARRRLREYYGY
jgi:hypothetical protein